jgi:hypothetical protein
MTQALNHTIQAYLPLFAGLIQDENAVAEQTNPVQSKDQS